MCVLVKKGGEITNETILMARSSIQEDGGNSDIAKLELYGRKTGLIGHAKPSTNEFLNY